MTLSDDAYTLAAQFVGIGTNLILAAEEKEDGNVGGIDEAMARAVLHVAIIEERIGWDRYERAASEHIGAFQPREEE